MLDRSVVFDGVKFRLYMGTEWIASLYVAVGSDADACYALSGAAAAYVNGSGRTALETMLEGTSVSVIDNDAWVKSHG